MCIFSNAHADGHAYMNTRYDVATVCVCAFLFVGLLVCLFVCLCFC